MPTAATATSEDFLPFVPTHNLQALAILKALPAGLQACLLAELRRGNPLVQVERADWPHAGSLFVSLGNLFDPATRDMAPGLGVAWRKVNDPHYWREDLSQVRDGVEHLVVC
ncbi:hypothetical protein PMI14_03559 [Acidovorax sp. CF316]|uniref:hypothetical protein n=1 Tax=Acidovorax sp. CF316 TaxID=1144317 RepID=UPI00026BCFB2|nr:hypothetical protein [Acidovorax sp. CF316]EJE51763.1 hypothetical protein PMI14_03559 [Acidovorax sp. CF316]